MQKRIVILFCALAVIAGALFARLLSLAGADALAETAAAQSTRTLTLYKTRGQIYDCDLRPLTGTGSTLSAAVLPNAENMDAVVKAATEDVRDRFAAAMPFVTRLRKVIRAAGVTVFDAPERYADTQLAAHIIGCVSAEGKGISGIERAYDDFLRENGTEKTISYAVSGTGAPLGGVAPKLSVHGNAQSGVVLTIDRTLQQIIETAGCGRILRGAIVMTEVESGEIKAAASFPRFSQNDLSASVQDTENAPMINRVLSAYAVGSSFKISTAAAALEAGISPLKTYTCTGRVVVDGQTFRCHKTDGHGDLDMQAAMALSCNTYFIRLAEEVGASALRNMASDLSFGKPITLADGMYTDSGTLPSESDLFNPAEVANFAFGQGKLTATPLQVNRMTLCILNDGRLPAPRLVKGTTSDGETVTESEQSAQMQVMSAETAHTIKGFLDDAVMQTDNQQAKPIRITAGGKTATAQTGITEDGGEALNTWFTGYFPAEAPKYAVTVLCENGSTGNLSAGPVFRKIADEVAALDDQTEQEELP